MWMRLLLLLVAGLLTLNLLIYSGEPAVAQSSTLTVAPIPARRADEWPHAWVVKGNKLYLVKAMWDLDTGQEDQIQILVERSF